MKKRILNVLFTCIVIVGLMAVMGISASAAEPTVVDSNTWGGIDWVLYEDGTLTISPTKYEITKKKPWSGELYQVGEWPAAVNDAITAITGWPYDRTAVKKLVIEEGVTSIGSFAAQKFTNLTGEVVIPSTVTYIGQEAFQASHIEKLTFAKGGTEELCIAPGAFKSLAITELALPDDRVVCMHCWAFQGCSKLESVTLPATIVKCSDWTHVDYCGMDYVDGWDSKIFADCPKIENITFGSEEVETRFLNAAGNRTTTSGAEKKVINTTPHTPDTDTDSDSNAIQWTAWNGQSDITYSSDTNEAYVYLFVNHNLTEKLIVPSGNTLNLCLNGKTLSLKDGVVGSVIEVEKGGVLNLCDCSADKTGKIVQRSGDGGCVYNEGTLTVHSGTIQGDKYGIYNLAVESTAAVYSRTRSINQGSGILNITGGSFQATRQDGRSIYNGGIFNLNGSPQLNDGIYLAAEKFITLTGSLSLTNNDTPIGVEKDGGGAFLLSDGGTDAVANMFVSATDNYTISEDNDGNLVLKSYFYITKVYGNGLDNETDYVLEDTTSFTAKTIEKMVFVGWYDDEDFTQPHDFSTPFTADDTLYAKYEPINLWVAGVPVTSDNLVIDSNDNTAISGSVTFDPATSTLTLDNFSYEGEGYNYIGNVKALIYSTGIDLKIVLKGANTLAGIDDYQQGIIIENGSLTIANSDADDVIGSLKLTAGYPVILVDNGSLFVENVNLTVINTLSPTGNLGEAIFVTGDISITNSDVTAISGDSDGDDIPESGATFGITTMGSISVTNSIVSAIGDCGGMLANGLSVTNSIVTVAGNYCALGVADPSSEEFLVPTLNGKFIVTAGDDATSAVQVAAPTDATYANKYVKIVPAHTITTPTTTGGTVTGGGTYQVGATVTLTATPNSGYNFVNWTKNGSVVSTDATYTFTATESAEYVANFQQNTPSSPPAPSHVSVTLVYGNGIASETKRLPVDTGAPAAPAVNGKVFAGWYDDAACTQRHDFSTPFTADDTLYARYVEIPERNRVSFVADGRLVGIILYRPSQTELTFIPKVPAKEGYVGTWETYTLNGKNMVVRAVYTPIN